MSSRFVALLGSKDSPTDAVEEYCSYLSTALLPHGIKLDAARVAWAENGWKKTLRELRTSARSSPGTGFLFQYTALAWSRRGFPWRVLSAIRILKRSGARVIMVFHDADAYRGSRMVDRVRRKIQLYTMQEAARLSDFSVFTIPLEKVPWAVGLIGKAAFIPVGANLSAPERAWGKRERKAEEARKVCVFSITGGQAGTEEANLIADTLNYASERLGAIRLEIIGRNSASAEGILRQRLAGKRVELVVRGLLSGDDLVTVLGACDAMLFVRGPISSRRGSAVAGIACGLPVIAGEGWETAAPITEAGVVLVPAASPHEFGPALLSVLEDPVFRNELAKKSREAQQQYFSWQVIAAKYAELLERAN